MLRMGNATLAPNLAKYRTIGYADNHVTVRAIKHSIDGALGPRGAWLLEPYEDKPGDTGQNTTKPDVIIEAAKLAIQHDYQLCVHAIGDRANRETLDIFENAFKANPDKKDRRWRVEHAQHINAADIPRFGQARRDRLDAGRALHVRRAVRPRAPRPETGRRRRLRLAEADEIGRAWSPTAPTRRWKTSIRSRATTRPSAAARGRHDFYPDQRMSRIEALKLLHHPARVRGVRGEREGVAQDRQARRCRRAVEGHHDGARAGIRNRQGRLHDRRRQGALRIAGRHEVSQSASGFRGCPNG